VALEQAGAFCIVLEAIPPDVAAQVTALVAVPTIGIGAGAGCDGQVLVSTDLLGLSRGHQPKFAKRFANLGDEAVAAIGTYVADVRAGAFPAESHAYKPNAAPSVSGIRRAAPVQFDNRARITADELDAPLDLDHWH
jgi:3-methyl-2-oxobutanoate hydroxymethyltransferase